MFTFKPGDMVYHVKYDGVIQKETLGIVESVISNHPFSPLQYKVRWLDINAITIEAERSLALCKKEKKKLKVI